MSKHRSPHSSIHASFAAAVSLCLAIVLIGCSVNEGRDVGPVGATSADVSEIEDAASSPSRQYLIFAIQNMPLSEARGALTEIKDFYGPNPPGATHLYGFSLWSLMLLKQSPAEMRAILNQAFDMAEESDLPTYLHLDMLHNSPMPDAYAGPAIKFHEDPMMCEWTAFPGPGERHGPVPRYWCNWGAWFTAPAFPCFTSPRLRELITTQLREGVLDPLHKRLRRLKSQNREYLFAGICIGWETHIPDLTPGQPFPFPQIDTKDPPVDRFSKPPLTMQPWEMGRFGFAALHHMGYDQGRLEDEAAERGVSVNSLFTELCHRANHGYTELIARATCDSGVPRERIYSHTVAISTVYPRESSFSPPVWAAVSPCCTPGFTMDKYGAAVYDVDKLKRAIRAADPTQAHFAVAETYFRRGCSEEQFTDFMDETLGSGATLMHILAWHAGQRPESPFYVPKRMAGPHLSIAKWLGAGSPE